MNDQNIPYIGRNVTETVFIFYLEDSLIIRIYKKKFSILGPIVLTNLD